MGYEYKRPWVTYALTLLIAVVFLWMFFDGGFTQSNLLKFGAEDPYLVDHGQWYRVITALFVHMNIPHIVFNAIALYYLGIQTEYVYGHWKMLLIFMISGIIGDIFGLLVPAISAGASTAIFGLIGAIIVLGQENFSDPYMRHVMTDSLILVAVNIGLDLVVPGISILGHIGGLIAGYLISLVIYKIAER